MLLGRRPRQQAEPGEDADAQYRRWLQRHTSDAASLQAMRDTASTWPDSPLFSIVVPVFETPPEHLLAMVESVQRQVYPDWELCIADDASTSPQLRLLLEQLAASESRIRVTVRERNGGIAAASNSALSVARGDFVALLDHDDLLQPQALYRVAEMAREHPDVDVLYSDEDKLYEDGSRGFVFFKRDFDPDYLCAGNYMCHLAVLRRSLVERIGGFREGFDGSQDHDLLLRATEQARHVVHVADVLYTWRRTPTSTSVSASAKPDAWENGRRAVADALQRRGIAARVERGVWPGLTLPRREVPASTTATVIVHGEAADASAATLRGTRASRRVEVIAVERTAAANTVERINDAVGRSTGEVVVIIAGGLAPSPACADWLTPLMEQALRPDVVACGARIVDADGAPEQEGLHLLPDGSIGHAGVEWPVIQRVLAVCDVLATSRSALLDNGGFDPRSGVHFDADFCLRIAPSDRFVMYTPLSEFTRTAGAPAHPWKPLQMRSSDPTMSPWVARLQPLTLRLDR